MNEPTTGAPMRIVIQPGGMHATDAGVTLATLLGSCVAVCLYDPLKRVVGINHFLLAERRYARDLPLLTSDAGRYGIHAMELLINGMLKLGARRPNLKAKAFGGANVLGVPDVGKDGFECVGAVNARFVQEFLKRDGIPLVASDLGGRCARQIRFHSADYSVDVRRIQAGFAGAVAADEKRLWESGLRQRRRSASEFW